MNFPRLTIDVFAGSDADQRKLGCVRSPERPCDEGQVPATKVVLLEGAPAEKVAPGNSVLRRLFRNTFCDVTRSFIVPPLVHSTSFTNCCVAV
jgi:hypothetical protein